MDWLATIFGITGSLLLSRGDRRLIPYTFVCYLIGSISWLVFGLSVEIYSLAVSSSVFTVIEAIGLISWIKVNKNNRNNS